MPITVKRTGSIGGNGVKCCVFGKSGIGKTKLLGTAPSPIVLSCESGLLSLEEEDIPYMEIEKVSDIYLAYKYLMGPRGRKYKTIGLDSSSEIAEVLLSDYKKDTTNNDPRAAYGDMAGEMGDIIRMFRDMKGRNVVFTAKRGRLVDPDSGLTQYVASMPGRVLPEGLPYYFDEVFYMDFHEKTNGRLIRVLKTKTSLEHDAKDRSGKLKPMELPNLTNIFNKIGEKRNGQNAKSVSTQRPRKQGIHRTNR